MPVTADNYRINELARFRILMGGICASICMSTFYGFNLLSDYMQTTWSFTSSDLTTITTTGIVVGFVTFPGGMLLDYAGPMYVCMIACVLNSLGALLFGLAFAGVIDASVVKFSIFCAIMNLGCASFDTGSLMAVMGSFPLTKGSVVAIMKTFAGLGASVLAVINYSFFRTTYPGYMYFMCALVVCCGSVASIFIRFPPYHLVDWERRHVSEEKQARRRLTEKAYLTQYPPMRRFYLGFGIIVALVIYLTTQSLCVAYVPSMTDGKRLGICIGCIVLVLCLLLVAAPIPLLGGMDIPYSTQFPEVPTEEEEPFLLMTDAEVMQDAGALEDMHDRREAAEVQKPLASEPVGELVGETSDDAEAAALAMAVFSDLDPQYQGTFWENVRGVDLWLCFWNTLATWGCGLVISFNSAQIYRALAQDNYDRRTNTLYSSIIGVGSALGRLSMGLFETTLVRYPSDNRPVMTIVYPVSATCMVIGLIFLMSLPEGSKAVIIGFFFDAFGNGFSWASTALTIRSLFANDIGKHYNFMYVGAFIAVIALNRFGYGELYDREARRQRDAAVAAGTTPIYPRCSGRACTLPSFGILLAVNATAIVGSMICHIRYRRFVQSYRKNRAEMKTAAVDADAVAYPVSS